MDAGERTGAGVDQPASGFEHSGAPPPPPPAFGASFEGFGGPGFFGPHGWGGPRGWGGPHGFGGPGRCARGRGPPGRYCHPREGDSDQAPPCERPGSPPNDENPGEPNEPPRDENAEGHSHGPHHGGSRHWGRRHGPHGPHGPWGRRRGPLSPGSFGGPAEGAFDMSPLFQAFASHPIAQALRTYAEQAGLGADREAGETDSENNFTPPIDVFSTPAAYVLHVALPGAKKEDVGVNWDAEKSELNVAGVVYRQGDEEFLKTLSKKERKVGVFERSVKLPPGEEEKEEVDGDNITAKLEDGVLIVTVPKVEKEWTEVKKVDIE
jgi:HSP20 family protein